MSATGFEAVPTVGADAERATAGGTADVVVMKFGGTSVADPERVLAVARRLAAARDAGNRVVGVLSAMGDSTDELLALAREISPEPQERELDMPLLANGSLALSQRWRPSTWDTTRYPSRLPGRDRHGHEARARIVEVRARRIHEALDRGAIVLVAGFQGVSTDAEVTTLGRGGSDTTAVALAAALGAEVCEILTDVEGVFSADPRLVADARKLEAVTYDEMLELSASGARVLQLFSVEFPGTTGFPCTFARRSSRVRGRGSRPRSRNECSRRR
jgi:aspartate kinase